MCVCVFTVDQPTETISYLLAKSPQQSESIVLTHFVSQFTYMAVTYSQFTHFMHSDPIKQPEILHYYKFKEAAGTKT